jgi:hypothetical protein
MQQVAAQVLQEEKIQQIHGSLRLKADKPTSNDVDQMNCSIIILINSI